MKKLWKQYKGIIVLVLVWRIILMIVQYVAPLFIVQREGFIGPTAWANFDGLFYLRIAKEGYYPLSEAFFPLYPLVIRFVTWSTHVPDYISAQAISLIFFVFGLISFRSLSKKLGPEGYGPLVWFLIFPASFFFAAVYTESMYFFFAVTSFVAMKQKKWLLSSVCIALASATRLFGVFLILPLVWEYLQVHKTVGKKHVYIFFIAPMGLFLYMFFLWQKVGDPLAFFHTQPAFGANRTGGSIILLPQVIWRYMKIFGTASPYTLSYMVSTVEFVSLVLWIALIAYGWKQKHMRPLLVYSLLVCLVPTLTGTLSSLPRYFLSAFPLFITLNSVHNSSIKFLLFVAFIVGLSIGCTLFLQGYFVA